MAAAKNAVKKAEAGGVAFEYDASKLNDARVVFAIGKRSDDEGDDDEKMMWYTRLMEMLFTSPWEVMTALADANGGECSVEAFGKFLTGALEAMQAKN